MECASSRPDRGTVNLPNIAVHNRYKRLSQRLFEVLEVVGASDKLRQLWRRGSVYIEAAFTVYPLPSFDGFVFGSSYEGTTTKRMVPDIDLVQIYNELEVVRSVSEAPGGDCLLLTQDDSAPPGYCKLQLVHNGVPMRGDEGLQNKSQELTMRSDKRNRMLCCRNWHSIDEGFERHGPAGRKEQVDYVFTLRCFGWPDCATEWLERKRNHIWPSPNLIQKCNTLGFLLVQVGHPNRGEKKFQWRLSFSHQERLLVEQFNSVQFKCYIVLKYLKMKIQGNNSNALFLSSYHLKTAMFYLIENTQSDFWSPENLVSCVIAALKMIYRWIETDNCPNYFIPDENMFEGKTDEKARNILCKAIHQIFNDFEHFIRQIQCDSLGELMNSSPHSQIFQKKKTEVQGTSILMLLDCIDTCLFSRNNTIRKLCSNNIEEFNANKTQLQCNIQDKVSQEQDKEKQTALSLCLSLIQVSLLSNTVALDIQENRSKEEIWKSLTCDSWRELHLKLDFSKLNRAVLLYMLEYYQDSLDNLASLEHDNRLSFCWCRKRFCKPKAKDLLEAGISSDSTPEKLLRDIILPCVVFLPNESSVTPIAIRYEMMRSFGISLESRDDDKRFRWYDWGVVDGRFLRHFLVYMNYSKLGSPLTASSKLDMLNILEEKVSHKETCHNLLGWVYKLNGEIDLAIHQFKLSLKTRPTTNSAYWHLCFIIRDLLAANSKNIE